MLWTSVASIARFCEGLAAMNWRVEVWLPQMSLDMHLKLRSGLRGRAKSSDPSSSWPIERSLLEILKSHFRCNFLFREELMMCTNDPEAGRNYCSRRNFLCRVKVCRMRIILRVEAGLGSRGSSCCSRAAPQLIRGSQTSAPSPHARKPSPTVAPR